MQGKIDQTRALERLAYRQPLNVLRTLRDNGPLILATQQRPMPSQL